MLNLKYYSILLGIGNIVFFFGLHLLFEDRIEIEYNINQNVIFIIILLNVIGIVAFSKILSLFLGEEIKKSIFRVISTFLISVLSLNIFGLLKLLYNIVKFEDILYENKFIKLRYKYTLSELLGYINNYYNEVKGTNIQLPLDLRRQILGEAKTVCAAKQNVEVYLNIEKNSIWTKIGNVCSKGVEVFGSVLDFMANHPYFSTSILLIISGSILYSYWSISKDSINTVTVSENVRTINQDMLQNSLDLNNQKEILLKVCNEILSMHSLNAIIYPLLHKFILLTATVIGEVDEEKIIQYKEICKKMAKKLKELISETGDKVKDLSNSFRPFTGEGHQLGGEGTRSKLIEDENK